MKALFYIMVSIDLHVFDLILTKHDRYAPSNKEVLFCYWIFLHVLETGIGVNGFNVLLA